MAKYKPTDIPPGETKRICDMTVAEYTSWRGRCGGSSRSKKKLRSQLKAARTKKPGLSAYHALVKRIANDKVDYTAAIKRLSTPEYPIDDAKAMQLLTAARKYRERNPS